MTRIALNSKDFEALAGAVVSGVRRVSHLNGGEEITFNDGTRVARDNTRLDEPVDWAAYFMRAGGA